MPVHMIDCWVDVASARTWHKLVVCMIAEATADRSGTILCGRQDSYSTPLSHRQSAVRHHDMSRAEQSACGCVCSADDIRGLLMLQLHPTHMHDATATATRNSSTLP